MTQSVRLLVGLLVGWSVCLSQFFKRAPIGELATQPNFFSLLMIREWHYFLFIYFSL